MYLYYSNETNGSPTDGGGWRESASLVRQLWRMGRVDMVGEVDSRSPGSVCIRFGEEMAEAVEAFFP